MKIYPLYCGMLAATLLSSSTAPAQNPSPISAVREVTQTEKNPGVREYQDDDIDLTLRKLAEEAKINMVISGSVKGTVTLRLEHKKPLEAIDIICSMKGLVFENRKGLYYVITPEDRKLSLHFLDSTSLPVALAKFRKRYYDALLAEGFSKEQAMKIVTSEQLPLGELKVVH